uniref:Ribulose bisphosphate carboxylase small subunit, chloroplastic n=1 Tax=Amphora coffeiformis TaxID=265554 RepID=A0A7S3L8T4_9STRA
MSAALASSVIAAAPAKASLKPASAVVAPVSNVVAARNMMTWNPIGNTMYETFSFLPPLSDDEIARQVDYIIGNGWTPCLEFAPEDTSRTDDVNTSRISCSTACYYDNRYWTLWKLPMFGCTNAADVLKEIAAAKAAYPECYIRVSAFDSDKQVQVASFLVQRISTALPMEKRSMA